MTNWEKLKEVFGIPEDEELKPTGAICSVVTCSDIPCSKCPIYECGMDESSFWKREYKDEKESEHD